jgi:hypothetical protein
MFRKHNPISTDPRGDLQRNLELAVSKARQDFEIISSERKWLTPKPGRDRGKSTGARRRRRPAANSADQGMGSMPQKMRTRASPLDAKR